MKAVIVRIYVDLECPADVSWENLPRPQRICLDRYFVIDEALGNWQAEHAASEFCCHAMQRGIRFVDRKDKSIRYIPAKSVVTIFQMPHSTVNPEVVEEKAELKVRALPWIGA